MIDFEKWCKLITRCAPSSERGMQKMNLCGSDAREEEQDLANLTQELVTVLEKINKLRPIKFHDYESDYWYNFLGIRDLPDMGYVFIEISGEYDNLPSHTEVPLKNGRNQPMPPYPDFT